MGSRTDFQSVLESILDSEEVYFQPPPSVEMAYPAIVYELNTVLTKFADNYPYNMEKQYMVTVIDRDPDSLIPDQLANLAKCVFDRHFVEDNLHHFVYLVYF